MKKYVIMCVNQFRVALMYRFNFLIKMITQISGIVLAVLTWIAIYQSTTSQTIGNFTLNQMVLYIILSNVSVLLFSNENVVRMGGLVRSGKLTTMLLRPYSLLGEFLAISLGQRLYFVCLYLVLMVGLGFYVGWTYWLLLMVYSGLIFVMYFLLLAAIGNLGFWLLQVWPLRTLLNALYMLLGGLLFPLNLLPATMYQWINGLPFSLIGYRYSLALQGLSTHAELGANCVLALIWIVVLYGIYTVSLRKGLAKYEGMGA